MVSARALMRARMSASLKVPLFSPLSQSAGFCCKRPRRPPRFFSVGASAVSPLLIRRASIDAINAEIAALAEDETWELLQGFADEAALQDYLDGQRELLLAELAVLQERWQALQG